MAITSGNAPERQRMPCRPGPLLSRARLDGILWRSGASPLVRVLSVRRRIGWVVAALLGSLLIAFAAAPYLVDVESYKPSLIEAVKDATGRELVIDGPMKLSVFPVPRISAQRVHFANAAGATGAQMIDVRWIGASPSWLPLLWGRIAGPPVTLYHPSIVSETDANGVPNWQFQPGAGAAQPAGAAPPGIRLAVGDS